MKKIVLASILMVSIQTSYAQWSREFSIGYSFANPAGQMSHYIKQGNGIVADFHFISPQNKFSFGVDLNYTVYGFDKTRQQYSFPDGTTADMNINVTNSFTNLTASGRYNLITGKKLTPYVGFKAGYSFFDTELTITDPNDWDSCSPVETDILKKDGTFIYSIGGGVKYDLSNLFKKMRNEFLYLNLSCFYTQGGMVNYMSTDAPAANHGSMSSQARDVEASFINNQTQVIHKHHVGYVYSSYAQMMDYRFAFTFRFPN